MNTEKVIKCPVCEGSSFSPYLVAKDYTVSRESFSIVRCKGCGFVLTNPRPTAEAIGTYYESSEYISHHDEAKDLMSRIYKAVRNYTTDQKLQLIQQHSTKQTSRRLLDVGCGTGFFASNAKAAGWQVAGTEPDRQAREVAQSRVGEHVYESIGAEYFNGKKFDVITLWHVLEHVHQLNEMITWLHEHLAEDGLLVVAVPNYESADAQAFGSHWAAWDVPRHLYHFSKTSIQRLMEKNNFHVKQIQPMWFDAFYVSMLSSRYQQGATQLPKSIWTGLRSNLRGRKGSGSDYNTSSLIYLIQKK
jgi:2-polyprenyl-3-methyl-5-hydroxy-6-metoxy-1,4-benzoquinol methylase